jgi:hypothetical protein
MRRRTQVRRYAITCFVPDLHDRRVRSVSEGRRTRVGTGDLREEQRRPTIDWTSQHRKRLSQYVFRNTCAVPERDYLEPDLAREPEEAPQ